MRLGVAQPGCSGDKSLRNPENKQTTALLLSSLRTRSLDQSKTCSKISKG